MTREGKKIDQRFAVFCYALAVCVSTLLSVIVSFSVKSGTNLYIYLSFLLPQAGYLGVFCFMYFGYYKNGFSGILKKENVRFTEYIFAVLIAAGLLFFAVLPNIYVRKFFEYIGIKATVIVPGLNAWYDYVLSIIILCVLPALGEELVFRKAFCDGMEEVADYKTILLCGLAFSLSHFNAAQTVHQFFLGCVLALVYVKTKNVTLTMTMHFINNFLAVFLEKMTGAEFWTKITVTSVSCAVGALLIGLGVYLIMRKGNKLDNGKNGRIENVTVILLVALGVIWAIMLIASFL